MPPTDPATLMMLFFGASISIFIMLLPALLELKRPRDAGPRMIAKDIAISNLKVPIHTLEKPGEKIELDHALMKRIADIISVLPNLEG